MSDNLQARPKVRRTRRYFGDSEWYINGYAEFLGTYATTIYHYLCCRADNETQTCYPGILTISSDCGMSRSTTTKTISELQKLCIIDVIERPGRSHKYMLLDVEHWLNPCARNMARHVPETWGHVPETWGHVPETWGHVPGDNRTKLYTKLSFINSLKKTISQSLGYSNIHPRISYATIKVNGAVYLELPDLDYEWISNSEQYQNVIQTAFEMCGGQGTITITRKEKSE